MGKRVGSALELREIATPTGNPPAGSRLVYVKSDGRLYRKDSAGVETEVSPADLAARIRRSAVQSNLATNVVTPIAWDTIIFNNAGMVPVVANGITAVMAGQYRISGSVALDFVSTTVILHVVMRVNGVDAKVVHRGTFASPSTPTVLTFCVDEWTLAVNDVVTLAVFHTRVGSSVSTYIAGTNIYLTELAVRRVGS